MCVGYARMHCSREMIEFVCKKTLQPVSLKFHPRD